MPDTPEEAFEADIITKVRSGSVADAVAGLLDLIESHGMQVFTIIDHSGEAERHGLELRDTKLVVFGSPTGGTPVMQKYPLAALDLPLKVLVWDDDGRTTISFIDPAVLAARYRMTDDLAARLAGIGPLTDALIG